MTLTTLLLLDFQPVESRQIRVLPALVVGSSSPPPCSVTSSWCWHLLDNHKRQFQQQRLEDEVWSRYLCISLKILSGSRCKPGVQVWDLSSDLLFPPFFLKGVILFAGVLCCFYLAELPQWRHYAERSLGRVTLSSLPWIVSVCTCCPGVFINLTFIYFQWVLAWMINHIVNLVDYLHQSNWGNVFKNTDYRAPS